MKYRIGIIEDNRGIKYAYESFFNAHPNFELVISAESVEDFMKVLTTSSELHIVLSDIGLPGMSGIEGIAGIKRIQPKVEIIMNTVFVDPEKVFNALCQGATGYLTKNIPLQELADNLLNIQQGGAPLSPAIARLVVQHFHPPKKPEELTSKEHEVVQLLVDGLTYKKIAERLFVSPNTVNSHIKNIYRKLEVNSKSEVVRKMMDRNSF